MWSSEFTRLDFQLAYLIMLTQHGLKPLSRWEEHLSEEEHELIRSSGLVLDTVQRRTRIGRKRIETVFAQDQRRTMLYRKRFDGTLLQHTPDVVRQEGWFFGYPSCCVKAFMQQPYTANGLKQSDQEILFHWACPACVTTPGLLAEYRRIHAECRRLHGGRTQVRRRPLPGWTNTAAKVAASLALVLGTGSLAAADDPHWLPVADDIDCDYLSVAEEILRGTDWENPDTDGNLVLDGVQTAHLLRELINSPPPGIEVTDHEMWGIETCSVCGTVVNMGFVRITHLQRGLSVEVPYIALHYLEHGSLSFDGNIHAGRADLNALKEILFPCDPLHLLPTAGDDPDEDGLLSEEELLLGTNPTLPDSDGDSLADGPQTAEDLLPLISELPREAMPDRPYMLEHLMDGIEQCEVCGITLNMGHAEIVNPLEELSISIPFVALHTLAHGGFVFDGSYNEGRVIPTILRTVLTGEGSAHWLPVPGDTDGDGLADGEEPYFGLDPDDPDEDANGIPDGRELATRFASQIHELPTGPLSDQTYVIDHFAYGHYNCVTCGELINMGFLEITDPVAGTSINVPYYNLHFMDRGSFSTDRDDLYPRVDPREVAALLGHQPTAVTQAQETSAFALWNAPNPFRASGKTRIVLSLPGEIGVIDMAIYDSAGRKVRDIYTGNAPGTVAQFTWNGQDDSGDKVAAGIYYCKVKIGGVSVTKKMIFLR